MIQNNGNIHMQCIIYIVDRPYCNRMKAGRLKTTNLCERMLRTANDQHLGAIEYHRKNERHLKLGMKGNSSSRFLIQKSHLNADFL
ncbi:hypothetical protein TNCV_644801 [Trichonephila clavipes]|nr:hypothetical protein TNCV_644801 [Trichonephila clavipes]